MLWSPLQIDSLVETLPMDQSSTHTNVKFPPKFKKYRTRVVLLFSRWVIYGATT